MSDINRLCDVMHELHYKYNSLKNNKIGSDKQIDLTARIELLELLLQEASFIKKDNHNGIN